MTVTVKHKFTSNKADSTDASAIRPSNWNDTHVITMATSKLLGRFTAGEGPVEELSVGTGLSMAGGVLAATASTDATTLGGQGPGYYTNIPARLGYSPVISDLPGRISLTYANAHAYYRIDAQLIELANTSEVANVSFIASNALNVANIAFNTIRLTGFVFSSSAYFDTLGAGYVVTGYARESGGTGQVQGLFVAQIQGYSPSRGWIAATN